MIFLLKRLNYFYKKERTLDVLIKVMKWLLVAGVVFSVIIGICTIALALSAPSKLSLRAYLVLFAQQFLSSSMGLYMGLWRGHLISRQRIKREERRREIEWNVKVSFGLAVSSLFFLVFLGLYLFVVPSLSGLYDQADTFIRYANWKVNYRTLSAFLASPLPFLSAKFFNGFLLVIPSLILPAMVLNSYQQNIVPYHRLWEQWIESRYFKHPAINNLVQDRDTKGIANLRLGYDSKTKDEVIMNAESRSLNTAYFGPIGAGKSAAQAKPGIMNDTVNFIYYIRIFADYIKNKRKEFDTQKLSIEDRADKEREAVEDWFNKGLARNFTNGFYVNEPSGDLIKDSLEIVKRSGLPTDMVWYINPPDPLSEAINILDNDLEDAAALTADLFRSFSEGDGGKASVFFLDAEESHTRILVTLLKYTAMVHELSLNRNLNGGAPTLSEFYELLRDKDYIFARLLALRNIKNVEQRRYQKLYSSYKKNYDRELARWIANGGKKERFDAHLPYALKLEKAEVDTKASKLDNLLSTISYFDDRLRKEKDGSLYFTFEANISGLQNTLIKLASDTRVRRVFFQQSMRSVDGMLKMGGMIFVNSARAELGEKNSKMVAQVAEIIMQSGAFKRLPNLWPIFPFLGDEKNTYIMPRDRGFLDQNRKYRTPVTHFYQNYEQVIASIGRENADALFESYRNAFVFQQQGESAVRYMTNRSGTKLVLEESHRFGESNVAAGEYGSGVTISESIVEKPKLSMSDVQKLEEMELLGIMVVDNEVSDPIRITSIPNYKLPMFSDKEFVSPFNLDNKQDKEAYEIWQEKVEEWYLDNLSENRYTKDDFTSEEWKRLMEIVHPADKQNDGGRTLLEEDINLFNARDEQTAKEIRESLAKETLEQSVDLNDDSAKPQVLENAVILESDKQSPSVEKVRVDDAGAEEVVSPEPAIIVAQGVTDSDIVELF